jgi:uncharacterized protein YyaL (SSP411 family)
VAYRKWFILLGIALFAASVACIALADSTTAPTNLDEFKKSPTRYETAARGVMDRVQADFYLPEDGLYARSLNDRHVEFMWGNGVMFTALLGAARHDPQTYSPILEKFFKAMDRYWDRLDAVPGYEPLPSRGRGNDKYYDDNAWMVIAFVEAYEMTRQRAYLERAQQAMDFVLSGWDEKRGGGIWWHEGHKDDSKNTCVNAPAAVGCLRLMHHQSPERAKESLAMATTLVDWQDRNLRGDDGLFYDRLFVANGEVNQSKFTYNTALMIRAYLGLYRTTNNQDYLSQAKRSAKASDWFISQRTGAFRDAPKFAHLLVEADLELYRTTQEPYLLQRAVLNADHEYAVWKQRRSSQLIENAAVARTLWLMADMQSDAGLEFWRKMDR